MLVSSDWVEGSSVMVAHSFGLGLSGWGGDSLVMVVHSWGLALNGLVEDNSVLVVRSLLTFVAVGRRDAEGGNL